MNQLQKSNKFNDKDKRFMQRALQLAARAKGRTSPNPLVGCVIIKDGKIIGEGFHQKAGTPHAEVNALKDAKESIKGATVFVTLEPCSHYGRTPPCANALVEAQVQRVVIAMVDPNPLVGGKGIEILRDAGINVDVGLLEEEAQELNRGFLKAIQTGLPYVVYKSALTLDGKIATESGDSKWVTNEASRLYGHQLRNQLDVIAVGSETVIKDNPALTCRIANGRDPVRLVIDGELKTPLDAAVLSPTSSAPCIIATTNAAPGDKLEKFKKLPNVKVWVYDVKRYVPLSKLLQDLVKRGWNSVLLEGGGGLAGAFLQSQLIDEIEFIYAPKLIGGTGPSPFSGLKIEKMKDAIPLEIIEMNHETGDLRIRTKVSYRVK